MLKTNLMNKSGFTLVELMVALVVTGIFLGGVFQIFMLQQQVFHDQNRIREAQQEMRIASDLITADFRALQSSGVDQVWVNFDGTGEELTSSNGIIIVDGTDGAPDELYVFNFWTASNPDITSEEQYTVLTRATSAADTMASNTAPIPIASAEPIENYIADYGLPTPTPDNPLLAIITGPTLGPSGYQSYVCDGEDTRVRIFPGGPERSEVFAITGISGNQIQHAVTPNSPWNTESGLTARYGFPGHTGIPGCLDAIDPDQAEIKPTKFLGWYIIFDDSINRHRLVRVENAIQEVVADYVRDFQIDPPNPGSRVFEITIEVWIPRPGVDPNSTNQDDFIVRSNTTKFFRSGA